jgi:hypothetical protein
LRCVSTGTDGERIGQLRLRGGEGRDALCDLGRLATFGNGQTEQVGHCHHRQCEEPAVDALARRTGGSASIDHRCHRRRAPRCGGRVKARQHRHQDLLQWCVGSAVVHPDQAAEQVTGCGAGQRGRHRLCGRPHAAVGVGKHVGHFLRAGGNPQAKAVIAEEWLAGGSGSIPVSGRVAVCMAARWGLDVLPVCRVRGGERFMAS